LYFKVLTQLLFNSPYGKHPVVYIYCLFSITLDIYRITEHLRVYYTKYICMYIILRSTYVCAFGG